MTSSLVGSEMCIRDRYCSLGEQQRIENLSPMLTPRPQNQVSSGSCACCKSSWCQNCTSVRFVPFAR
eukprot:3399839-Prorocentrum_lima.AAC.1